MAKKGRKSNEKEAFFDKRSQEVVENKGSGKRKRPNEPKTNPTHAKVIILLTQTRHLRKKALDKWILRYNPMQSQALHAGSYGNTGLDGTGSGGFEPPSHWSMTARYKLAGLPISRNSPLRFEHLIVVRSLLGTLNRPIMIPTERQHSTPVDQLRSTGRGVEKLK